MTLRELLTDPVVRERVTRAIILDSGGFGSYNYGQAALNELLKIADEKGML